MGELRIFAAVVEQRSFRKAAAVLHLTQPAVTKAIGGLEETLGVKLFDRVANGVERTVRGRSFAPRAQAVFDELRRAAQDLALLSSGAAGSLRIGTVPLPAHRFVPVAANRLLDQQPNVAVSLVEAHETELLERLHKREIELAVLRLQRVDPEEDLRVERLFDEQPCVVAAQTHPLAARSHLPELLRQGWVLPPPDCLFYKHVQRSLDRLHMPMPRHAVEAMSIHLQCSLVQHAGMLSFGMCPQNSLAPGNELVVRLPFELPVTSTVVAAVSLKSHEPSPLARQFVAHLRSLVAMPSATAVPQAQPHALIEATL
jgi:DNA-binding transcriptional LysR family regulator